MSLLEVYDMSHAYGDRTLYKHVQLELYKGEHLGVVGQNGTGKSTLISILTGEIIPDGGSIKWQSNIKIGHLDQYAEINGNDTVYHYLQSAFTKAFNLEKEINRLYEQSAKTGNEAYLLKAAEVQEQLDALDYFSIESNINKVVHGLGIDAIGVDRPIQKLSGGQRAKVILAKLLLEKPDVLLLDEPTNFLDKEHVDWLSDYLSLSKQAFIVVTHNYEFLESIATSICDIEGETIRKYYGKFSEFLKQKAHLREDHIRQFNAQQKKIEQTEAYIRKNKAGVNSRIARGRQKQLDRLERIAPPNFVSGPSIRFREVPLTAQVVLEVHQLEVGYEKPLLPKMNFAVTGAQKVVITGFNGIGKSTLLKTLVGRLPSLSGRFRFAEQIRIGYYEQDLKWDDDDLTPIQIISEKYPRMSVKDIRRHLSQCGIKDAHVMQSIRTLSGGEQSKVKLCRLILSEYNVLIMDEPTSHLDAETKVALQKALMQFAGSIILVSHEQDFYLEWADRVLNIEQLMNGKG
ncbi:ABC-F family ATP-binding cassette domain-containing protein [Paenibacillus sp. UNC451MF]|uniref:ABC-F family ATP-binding cassette domain-containing protein n=1 Tax=Paenibacillus sp. UNC451MF TaxID=1449063 RepID=UPI00048A9D6F|nr:ABC-F family ATP-binding cassette domain-containing protein [Paenibacillus sp. UNC451MF]